MKIIYISKAIEKRDRIEAYEIGEKALHIFEHVFYHSLLMRSALVGALDYANGLVDEHGLSEYRREAQKVVDQISKVACIADSSTAWDLHPGIMAAYAILGCLQEDLNLKEVKRRYAEAVKFFTNQTSTVN